MYSSTCIYKFVEYTRVRNYEHECIPVSTCKKVGILASTQCIVLILGTILLLMLHFAICKGDLRTVVLEIVVANFKATKRLAINLIRLNDVISMKALQVLMPRWRCQSYV